MSAMMAKRQCAMLLDLVKTYPVLYDKSHPKYYDDNKLMLWEDIAGELNIPSAQAIRKWNDFVDNYKKYLRYTKTKSTRNEPIRLWMWAANIAFLHRHLDLDEATKNEDVTRKRIKISIKEDDDDSIFLLSDEEGDETDVESPREKKIKKETSEPEIPCSLLETPANVNPKPIIDSSHPERSHVLYDTATFTATEHVMLGFAKSIDGLSEKRRIATKKKIAEVLRQAEMEELKEKTVSYGHAAANTSMEDIVIKREEIEIEEIQLIKKKYV